MGLITRNLVVLAVASTLLFIPLARSEEALRTSVNRPELLSLLAPVALYPDTLLSELLQAATFPEDVAEAAQWARGNPALQGEAAVRAAVRMPWDTSVQ